MLRISVDKVCMVRALALAALGTEPDEDVEPVDGTDGQPLPSSEDYDETRAFDALFDYVNALTGEELADLMALVWLGRTDFTPDEWDEARQEAEQGLEDDAAMAALLQDPTLPDDLAEGLEALGLSCDED